LLKIRDSRNNPLNGTLFPNGQPILLVAWLRLLPERMFATVLRRPPHWRFYRNGGAVRAFALVNKETTMPFSLSSYLLGVGTVVGALAFGFGGGVLLTKTAMKDTSTAETRVERVKRAETSSAPQQPVETVDTKAAPGPPPAEPVTQAAAPASPVQASTGPPGAEPPKPIAEAPKPADPATTAQSPAPTALARPAQESTPSAEQREAELRKAEARKIERQKRDAERKAKATALAKAKQRQFEEQPEPSRREYVYERSSKPALALEREESRFNPFDIPLFGRSRESSPIDRED
jgi:hypothetical protein